MNDFVVICKLGPAYHARKFIVYSTTPVNRSCTNFCRIILLFKTIDLIVIII